jgi:hypothetical protein
MKVQLGSINRSSGAVLRGAAAGLVVCFGSIPSILAQSAPNLRLVDYTTSSRQLQLTAPCTTQTNQPSIAEAKGRDLSENIIKPTTTTSADRWMKFENEYGIGQESPSAICRMFQVAKYGLDRMTFTAQETAKRCEFTYDLGDAPVNDPGGRVCAPQYAVPMFGKFGRAQFKSEVTIHDPQTGQAFIGLKLAIPFGQGG